MTALPTGTVTFLFTDIEGSTRLLQAGREVYRAALARHDAIIREAVTAHAGTVFKTVGDGFCAAFVNPVDATLAALTAQLALWHEPWGEAGQVRSRMALHTGTVELQGEEYFGAPLHRVARLLDCAHGGQTVLSGVTAALVGEALPDGVWLKDLGEYRLRDLPQPERIHQLCATELPDAFPPLQTGTAAPNNLPPQATAFIGREQQRRAVAEVLLRTDTRLVTLTGPGGAGKTRLSLQVAADLLNSFPDGVFFVPLASISDPDLVPPAIAQALDVRETAGRPIQALVADHLRAKELLLVLDNFEQVLDAAPRLAELLMAAPRLKMLVTSRAVLRLYGEREYPVPSLSLPDRRANPTAAHLAQFEAIRLFVDRAQAARPDLVLTDENAGDIAEICQRLDGLPLAIELAATRLRSLPPRAMLQRMARRLPLLTGGARDLPARQRTLRDAIAWSFDLLDHGEQALFRRLGVFWGCSLEAAEAVCAGELPEPGKTSVALPPLEIDVLDGLESLVEKSLLRQVEGVDGQARYTMLETIREYALEQLQASGEIDVVHRRHALHALELAQDAEREMHRSEQTVWFARLEEEHDNLRSALRWCEERGYAVPAYRLIRALWWFWNAHGHATEGRERIGSVLARFPTSPASRNAGLRAGALFAAGMLALAQTDHPAAQVLLEEALALYRALEDDDGRFLALEALANGACLRGDEAAALRYCDEVLPLAQATGDPIPLSSILNILGSVHHALGNLDLAQRYLEEGVEALADIPTHNALQISLALVLLDQGKHDEAHAQASLALDRYRRVGYPRPQALCLVTLGRIEAARGDLVAARDHLRAGMAMMGELGDVAGVADVLERFVELAMAQSRFAGALRLAGAAAALRRRVGSPLLARGQESLDRLLEPARQALGPADANAALQAGHALDLAEAMDEALAVTEPAPEPAPEGRTSSQRDAARKTASPLTRREQEVAVLVARGLTNRQIGERLVITEQSAASHIAHIYTKLGMNNRAQLTAWVVANGLLDDADPR